MNSVPASPARPAPSSPEAPWSIKFVNQQIKGWIERLGEVWLIGQVVQFRRRPGNTTSFFTLRDLDSQVTVTAKAFATVLDAMPGMLQDGDEVLVRAKPAFYEVTGSFSLDVREIRRTGTGNFLAQIDELRRRLAAEGLFEQSRKKPLPFWPRKIGLLCGHEARAQQDVIVNARAQWPLAEFEVREVLVQGRGCVESVCRALAELDARPDIEVIVITRGGGSLEDLLGFYDEQMVRAVAAAHTPVVSAIGHEEDRPLIDLAADYAATTPTDAGKRIVPSLLDEERLVGGAQQQLRSIFTQRLAHEQQVVDSFLLNPVLANPAGFVAAQEQALATDAQRLSLVWASRLQAEEAAVGRLEAQLKGYSPLGVLERGFSIMRKPGGSVVTDAAELARGEMVEMVFARGSAVAKIVGANPQGAPWQEQSPARASERAAGDDTRLY